MRISRKRHKLAKVPDFLNEAKPNVEQLRLVAQALAGPALKGGELADVLPTARTVGLGKTAGQLECGYPGITPALPRHYPLTIRSLPARYPGVTRAQLLQDQRATLLIYHFSIT